MENKKRNNSLFTLEQGLLKNQASQQQSQQPSVEKPKRCQEEARAFDFGEAIELRYDSDAFPTATPKAESFSTSNSFASELTDESLPFEVEAFEVDREVTPVSKPIEPKPQPPLQPEIQPESASEAMEVRSSETPLKTTRSVKQPTTVTPSTSKEELSDAQAFAADLQAILNGEKTYDTQQQQVVSTSSPTPPPTSTAHPHDIFDKGKTTTIPPQQSIEPEPVPMSRSHAVFDQMGQNMAHATDFDQGTMDLALEQSFDEFDRILDEQAQEMKVRATHPNNHDFNQEEEETLEAKKISVPLEMDTSELPSDRNLMTQALETQKSPTTKKTSSPSKESEKSISDEEDLEEMIPPEVWF
ncbi:MAG: hypothetical protein QNJ72_12925 [Pleurocapsa sp. MO_226.B13]|nr:hypothetical protein [Pleurocapsa sp. MO_226.B13]